MTDKHNAFERDISKTQVFTMNSTPVFSNTSATSGLSRAGPSRAEPSRAEPSQTEPNRAEASRSEPSRAEPEATCTSYCAKTSVFTILFTLFRETKCLFQKRQFLQ